MYTMFVVGSGLAIMCVNENPLKNGHYNRPDLKPKAAMVEMSDRDFEEINYRQLKEQNYHDSRKVNNRSNWNRFFRPLTADYTVRDNKYTGRDQS